MYWWFILGTLNTRWLYRKRVGILPEFFCIPFSLSSLVHGHMCYGPRSSTQPIWNYQFKSIATRRHAITLRSCITLERGGAGGCGKVVNGAVAVVMGALEEEKWDERRKRLEEGERSGRREGGEGRKVGKGTPCIPLLKWAFFICYKCI